MTGDEFERLAAKIDKALEGGEEFDAEEVHKLRRLIILLDRIEALGFLAKWALYALLAVTPVLANWERLLEWWKNP